MAANDPTRYARFTSEAFADPDADVGRDPAPGHTGRVPQGLALVQWLEGELEAAGQVLLNQWVTPSGHAFDVTFLGKRFDLTVARVPEAGDAEWLLTLEPRRGLLPWRRPSVTGLEAVKAAVVRALAGDPRVEAVRWVTAAELDAEG